MKNILFAVGTSILSTVCLAQPTYVTTTTCGTGGASCTLSPNISVQTGDLILVQVTTSSCPGSNTLTVTDGTNTYTHIVGSPWTGTGGNDCVITGILEAIAAGNATLTVVCHDSISPGFLGCSAVVYRQASIALDQIAYLEAFHVANCTSGCVATTGTSGVTGNTSETLVSFYSAWSSASGTWTVGSGGTQRQQITGSPIPLQYIEEKVVSSKGAYAGTVTLTVGQASIDGIIVTLGSPPFNANNSIHHRVLSQ